MTYTDDISTLSLSIQTGKCFRHPFAGTFNAATIFRAKAPSRLSVSKSRFWHATITASTVNTTTGSSTTSDVAEAAAAPVATATPDTSEETVRDRFLGCTAGCTGAAGCSAGWS